MLGVKDGERWWQVGENGRTLFDRPKPTEGCNANGRKRSVIWKLLMFVTNSAQLTVYNY